MNPFADFPGIRLNGVFYPKDLVCSGSEREGLNDFEREVFAFAAEIFGKKETIEVQTSGSTGAPKKQVFEKRAFLESARATNGYFRLDENSKAALVLPMRYIAGKMMVARAITGQYDLVARTPSGNPLESLTTDGLSFIAITPFQAQNMLANQAKQFAKIGAVLIGGGAISQSLSAALSDANIAAYASFGMTETLSHFALARLNSAQGPLVYQPLDGVELRCGTEGALEVRWPKITGDWVETNDLVRFHPGGFEWLGRRDFLINSGGVKIIPEMVEARLAGSISLPFFVAGTPHPSLGEVPILFLESGDQTPVISLDGVRALVQDQPYWQPKEIVMLKSFAYTESGKIKRKATIDFWSPSAD